MAAKLTLLQGLKGWIVLGEEREGWQVEQQDADIALGERMNIPPGRHQARGRATTTQPGEGVGFALHVYVFETDTGLCAVKTAEAEFAAA